LDSSPDLSPFLLDLDLDLDLEALPASPFFKSFVVCTYKIDSTVTDYFAVAL